MYTVSMLFHIVIIFAVIVWPPTKCSLIPPTERANACTGHPEGADIRDVTNCSRYYKCIGGQLASATCPEGQLFNDFIGKCDQQHLVECFKCDPDKFFYDLPVPNECQQFIRCHNGKASQKTCSAGLAFDPSIESCNIKSAVPCPFVVRCPENNEHLIMVADKDSCDNFFVCISGKAQQFTCPDTLHFNRITQRCDLPENAKCAISVNDGKKMADLGMKKS